MRDIFAPFSLLLAAALLTACASTPPRPAAGNAYQHRTLARPPAPPPGFPRFVDHSVGEEEVSIQAMSLVGLPYRWGGNTPQSGFDCSGLVRYVVARAANVDLPRTTAEMSQQGVSVPPEEISPGDLIFFNTSGRPHSHVGIYVGKLRFVNAPSTGGTVRIDYLSNAYWAKRFDGIRRVASRARRPVPFNTPTWEARADLSGQSGAVVKRAANSQAALSSAGGEQAEPAAARAATPASSSLAVGVVPLQPAAGEEAAVPGRHAIAGSIDAATPSVPVDLIARFAQAPGPHAASPAGILGISNDPIARFAGSAF